MYDRASSAWEAPDGQWRREGERYRGKSYHSIHPARGAAQRREDRVLRSRGSLPSMGCTTTARSGTGDGTTAPGEQEPGGAALARETHMESGWRRRGTVPIDWQCWLREEVATLRVDCVNQCHTH